MHGAHHVPLFFIGSNLRERDMIDMRILLNNVRTIQYRVSTSCNMGERTSKKHVYLAASHELVFLMMQELMILTKSLKTIRQLSV